MEKELRQLETALNELHNSNDVSDAAYSTLKFAVWQVNNCIKPAVSEALPCTCVGEFGSDESCKACYPINRCNCNAR